nr:unnamed protein product [uncultured archaeal virus]
MLFEEYEEMNETLAIECINEFKETVEDLKQEKYRNHPDYVRIAKDDLFDVLLAISKIKKFDTTELREQIFKVQEFLKEKNVDAVLKVQLDFN